MVEGRASLLVGGLLYAYDYVYGLDLISYIPS
jgi:hypothetical protein